MPRSGSAAPRVLLGSREPRIRSVPAYVSTTGPEAIELCSLFKLELDPWQRDITTDILGEAADGRWAASEAALVVPRQNGKSEVLIARIIAGLFLLGEEEIIYSAHRADTSMKLFQRFIKYLRRSPAISRQMDSKRVKVNNTHGQEGVTLTTGQTVGFRTRAQEGGRGFSADCIIFDEAFELSDDLHAAILPTLIARPNPQVLYAGTAVDQMVHRNGIVFARVRERGLRADRKLAYFEWSHDGTLDRLDPVVLDDHKVWAANNPSLGYRANLDMIALLRGSMKSRKFATECLCIGDWPRTDDNALHVIDLNKWDACLDEASEPQNPVCFAFDVTPDRSWSSIASFGSRADGLPHLELIEHRRGTGWVARRLTDLRRVHKPHGIFVDAGGPAGALVPEVEHALGTEITKLTTSEMAKGFGQLCDDVEEHRLRHLGDPDIRAALDGATTRNVGGAVAWDRRTSEVDISPLVAATAARFGHSQMPQRVTPRVINLARI